MSAAAAFAANAVVCLVLAAILDIVASDTNGTARERARKAAWILLGLGGVAAVIAPWVEVLA